MFHQIFNKLWAAPGIEVEKMCSNIIKGVPALCKPEDTAILNVAADYPNYPIPGSILYHHTLLNDGHNDPRKITGTIHVLNLFLLQRKTVVVHCHNAISRTPAVIAAYYAWVYSLTFDEALEEIKRRYSRANPYADLIPDFKIALGILKTLYTHANFDPFNLLTEEKR